MGKSCITRATFQIPKQNLIMFSFYRASILTCKIFVLSILLLHHIKNTFS